MAMSGFLMAFSWLEAKIAVYCCGAVFSEVAKTT